MSKSFSFKESKDKGDAGETLFLSKYADVIEKTPDGGRINDFRSLKSKKRIELKTEFYHSSETPNFFIERYSNDNTLTNGGPWQALEKNSDFFIDWFFYSKDCFLFETQALVSFLESESKLRTHRVHNRNYSNGKSNEYWSFGFIVPRELLSEIYKEFKLGAAIPLIN